MELVLQPSRSDLLVQVVLDRIGMNDSLIVQEFSSDEKQSLLTVSSNSGNATEIRDSVIICEFLLGKYAPELFDPSDWVRCLQIDSIIELCLSRLHLDSTLSYFDSILSNSNFLVGNEESFADLVFFNRCQGLKLVEHSDKILSFNNVRRHIRMLSRRAHSNGFNDDISQLPSIAVNDNISQLPSTTIVNGVESSSKNIEKNSCTNNEISVLNDIRRTVPAETLKHDKCSTEQGYAKEGKFIDLPGASNGRVVVRFPPEASGYLHIGHVKAALLNQFYKENFDGKLILRFDDTNPAKETHEYEQAIMEDVKSIGLSYDTISHTSDYFDLIQKSCEMLIKKGLAYCDNTSPEQMKCEREARIQSKCSTQSIDDNLHYWNLMKSGSEEGQLFCVRAKIDMQSNVGCMRDPTIYRCKQEPHVKCGHKYKVYPTYDFACPIVDSVEGVTHALRTTEYHDRDQQYYWFINALELRRPHIYEYGRLNLQYTVLSKRKLQWFVTNRIVDGWNDPRMPTLRGIFRRGLTLEGLRAFIAAQGSSKSVINMSWDKVWAINHKFVDKNAIRYTALMARYSVPVHIDGEADDGIVLVDNHPKQPSLGKRPLRRSKLILIDLDDAMNTKLGEKITLMNWGNATVERIYRNPKHNQIDRIDMMANFEDKSFKGTTKLSWMATPSRANDFTPIIAVDYTNLVSKSKLEPEDDVKDFCKHLSKFEYCMIGEPAMKQIRHGEIIQIQRRGYFICDREYSPACPLSGVQGPLVLISVPDGSTKQSPTSLRSMADRLINQRRLPFPSNFKSACTYCFDDHMLPPDSEQTDNDKTISQLQTKSQSEKKPAKIKDKPRPEQETAYDLHTAIVQQGDKVRSLKSSKPAPKDQISKEVEILLSLKKQYLDVTGKQWQPDTTGQNKVDNVKANMEIPESQKETAYDLHTAIVQQGDKVRSLKSSKPAPKDQISKEVEILLSLKKQYLDVTGKQWQPDTPNKVSEAQVEKGASKFDSKEVR